MSLLLNIQDLENAARGKLSRDVFDYYSGAAWDLHTLQENREAYRRLQIHYRVLRDVSQRSTQCKIFGATCAMPIFVAPTAFHKLADPEGELATAKGAGAVQTLMTLSSLSTCKLEDVAKVSTGPLWFQLYINKDRSFTERLVRRAVAAGYQAIVVTVDTPCWGVREADVRNGFHLPDGMEPVNLTASDDRGSTLSHSGSGMGQIMSWMLDASLTWKDITWIAEISKIPVLVKGICRADDAVEAVRHGAAGIIVSNHGGRQLDGAPATLDVLPYIVKAVNRRVPILIDGGIRRGTDVLKALASGATAVQVGRPVLWGLASGGQEGVQSALLMLQKELDLAMALSGCASLEEITSDLLEPPVVDSIPK